MKPAHAPGRERWGLSLAAGLGAVALGAGVSARPSGGKAVVLLLAALLAGAALRRLSALTRGRVVGLYLGLGELPAHYLGPGASLVLVVLLAVSVPRPCPKAILTKGLWLAGMALLAGSVYLTTRAGHVPLSVLLTLVATGLAGLWMFAPGAFSEESRALSALGILQTAGLVAGLLVFLSAVLGHPLVPITEHQAQNALVAGGATRTSGSFGAPNEAGLVLSAGALAALLLLTQAGAIRRHTALSVCTLFVAAAALVLTGSRASLLAFVVGAAVLALPILRRRVTLAIALGIVGLVATGLAIKTGSFTGRSLNIFHASDPSSAYRAHIRSYLLGRVDWTQAHGFGFSVGSDLAKNPISGSVSNVDEAWIYSLLSLGILSVVAYVCLILAGILRTLRVTLLGGAAALAWILASSLSENLFVLQSPVVCAMLLLGGAATLRRGGAAPAPIGAG